MFRRVKLSKEQYKVVSQIAKELKISKEEVLWVFVELGMNLLIISQKDPKVSKKLKQREDLPEYKNWEAIAKLQYKYWLAGAKNRTNINV